MCYYREKALNTFWGYLPSGLAAGVLQISVYQL